jgi:hypothetical protein
VSRIADPFNGHIDEFRIAHVQRSDGWIETTWNSMSDPGAFAVAGTEEQEGGEPLPPAGAGVVVCLTGWVRAFDGAWVWGRSGRPWPAHQHDGRDGDGRLDHLSLGLAVRGQRGT